MPRPQSPRRICRPPEAIYFKPSGIPLSELEEIVLTLDEIEAVRLADLDGRYHEEAGDLMGVSRPTFGRIIESARRKIADALANGKALRIEGGNFTMAPMRKFGCSACNHVWEVAYGIGRPAECPQCKSRDIHRAEEDRGYARGGRGGSAGQGRQRGLRRGLSGSRGQGRRGGRS